MLGTPVQSVEVRVSGQLTMVLIRLAILLAFIGLLVPKDERKQAEMMATAKDAAQWAWTYCDRNAEQCLQAREIGRQVAAKAQDGLMVLIATAREMAAGAEATAPKTGDRLSAPGTVPAKQSAPDADAAGTLSAEDRVPAWRPAARSRPQSSS